MAFDIWCQYCQEPHLPSDYCPVNDRTPATGVHFCLACAEPHPLTEQHHASGTHGTTVMRGPGAWWEQVAWGLAFALIVGAVVLAMLGFGRVTGWY